MILILEELLMRASETQRMAPILLKTNPQVLKLAHLLHGRSLAGIISSRCGKEVLSKKTAFFSTFNCAKDVDKEKQKREGKCSSGHLSLHIVLEELQLI